MVNAAAAPAGKDVDTTEGAPSFFFWFAIVMAAPIFIGFGMSYFVPIASGAGTPLPPVVHIHGVFYFLWMLWVVMQSALVRQHNLALHRSMGMLGIGLASGVVLLGTAVTALFAHKTATDPMTPGLTYISIVALGAFLLLFWLAINNVRDGDAHKRYIVLATLPFVIGGLNRMYTILIGLDVDTYLGYFVRYITVDVLIAALVVYDYRTLGTIHKATLIGAAVNILPQLVHVPIVEAAWFAGFNLWLGNMAYY